MVSPLTVKKVIDIPVSSRDVSYQTLSSREYVLKLLPARESLVSDIPAEDGKIANLFYSAASEYIAFCQSCHQHMQGSISLYEKHLQCRYSRLFYYSKHLVFC
jgi:hypothetical protein